MPVTKSLAKIEKIKSSNKLHPRGRKLKQLNRAQLRQDKLASSKAVRTAAREHRVEWVRFMRSCDHGKDQYTLDEIKDFAVRFVCRFDKEIETHENSRRPGRPASTQQDRLQRQKEALVRLLRGGISLPDLRDTSVVESLRKWDESLESLPNLKTVEVTAEVTNI